MKVASLELCKELYELSGWEETDLIHYMNDYSDESWHLIGNEARGFVYRSRSSGFHVDEFDHLVPAYALGYLLRKLPVGVSLYKGARGYTFNVGNSIQHSVQVYEVIQSSILRSNTPEDAAAKLAIELFKQGILARDGDG